MKFGWLFCIPALSGLFLFVDPFLFSVGRFYSIQLPPQARLLGYCRFRYTFPYVLDPTSAAYHIEKDIFQEWLQTTAFKQISWVPPALDVATPINLFKNYGLSESWESWRINTNDVLYYIREKKLTLYYNSNVQVLIVSIYNNPPHYF